MSWTRDGRPARAMSRVLHVDTAPGWRGRPEPGAADRARAWPRAVTRWRSPAGRAASSRRARAPRACASRPVPFRGDLWPPAVGALAARPARGPARRGAAARPARGLRGPPGRAAWPGAARVVAARRVDFPLRGPLSRGQISGLRASDRRQHARSATCSGARGLPEGDPPGATKASPTAPPLAGGRAALRRAGGAGGRPGRGERGRADRSQGPRDAAGGGGAGGGGAARGAFRDRRRRRGARARCTSGGGAWASTLTWSSPGFRDDLDRLVPAFDVFCLSSHLEGLGTSLLDAMAFARPVVATAAGGIPDAVVDGVTGPPRARARSRGAGRRRCWSCSPIPRARARDGRRGAAALPGPLHRRPHGGGHAARDRGAPGLSIRAIVNLARRRRRPSGSRCARAPRGRAGPRWRSA